MKSHVLLLVASVAALGACNRAATNNSTAAAPAAGGTANAAAPAAPAAPMAGGDVSQQLQVAAQAIQAQAPMRQGPVTITGAEVEGSTLVTAMTMPVELDDNTINLMQQQLGAQLCQNPQFLPMVRAGASFAYDITDASGEEHRVNVPACPGV